MTGSAGQPAVLFESCVDTVDAAVASEAGGAGRIELCARLEVGGTTPNVALVERCVAAVRIPVFTMVRPRGGSFAYDAAEADVMARDIAALKAAGARGLVFGALTRDDTIDVTLMARLSAAAQPLPVTCHRAIDAARNLREALDDLLGLGVDRVLTSGGAPSAAQGAAAIAALVRQAGDALVVMAGGGVRAANVGALVRATGVREVHARLLGLPAASAEKDATAAQARFAEFVGRLRG